MKKLIIVSQTCPHCYSLIQTISEEKLYSDVLKNLDIKLMYYDASIDEHRYIMNTVIEYAKEKFNYEVPSDIVNPELCPVFLQQSDDSTVQVIQLGLNGIANTLKELRKIL